MGPTEEEQLAKVLVVEVGHGVEDEPVDLAQRLLEGGRKVARKLGRKRRLVADGALRVRHDVVDVLRRRQPDLLAPVVHPRVVPATPTTTTTTTTTTSLATSLTALVPKSSKCGNAAGSSIPLVAGTESRRRQRWPRAISRAEGNLRGWSGGKPRATLRRSYHGSW